nr:MAG TPA: hypothetical protein [Caudoviricetes sp.]
MLLLFCRLLSNKNPSKFSMYLVQFYCNRSRYQSVPPNSAVSAQNLSCFSGKSVR